MSKQTLFRMAVAFYRRLDDLTITGKELKESELNELISCKINCSAVKHCGGGGGN